MKHLLGALTFTVAFAFAQHAAALTIEARLDSFESTPVSAAGIANGSGGGRANFTITGGDSLVGTDVDFLGTQFSALCLEPQEFISTNTTYRFSVVDLSAAPTSRPGGMGAGNAQWVDNFIRATGLTNVESIASGAGLAAMQMVAWEAAFETAGVFNRDAGLQTITAGGGSVSANGVVNALEATINGPALTGVESYALLNTGIVGGIGTRALFRGQDFMVFEAVPTPAPMFLFGLGLMGLGYVWQKRKA